MRRWLLACGLLVLAQGWFGCLSLYVVGRDQMFRAPNAAPSVAGQLPRFL